MFKPGDTVIFEPKNLNQNYWNSLTIKQKQKYYGVFYDNQTGKLLTFICEHHPQEGHCVLMDMHTGQLLPMCHMGNFRLATDMEC